MNNVIEFLSDNFLSIFSIIIGIVVSWTISKHFFFKGKPTKLQEAKRLKTTDFGDYRKRIVEKGSTNFKSEYFGTWQQHANGTVTDFNNNLTWISAPWGTTWNGKQFVGNPISLNWLDASQLFGRGLRIERNEALPTLPLNKRPLDFKLNYQKGSCKVHFADSTAWRLPTAAELDTLQFYISQELSVHDYVEYDQERQKLENRLFPYLTVTTHNKYERRYVFWSADTVGQDCAWTHAGFTPLEDTAISEQKFVLFVKGS